MCLIVATLQIPSGGLSYCGILLPQAWGHGKYVVESSLKESGYGSTISEQARIG